MGNKLKNETCLCYSFTVKLTFIWSLVLVFLKFSQTKIFALEKVNS